MELSSIRVAPRVIADFAFEALPELRHIGLYNPWLKVRLALARDKSDLATVESDGHQIEQLDHVPDFAEFPHAVNPRPFVRDIARRPGLMSRPNNGGQLHEILVKPFEDLE